MGLFQNSVVNKHLNSLDSKTISNAYSFFKTYFLNPEIQLNIRNAKEEQFQEGFLRELFVKVLGYKLYPETNYNLTTEYKNVKDSKKADGAIVFNGIVKGVIELKGTNTTDLSKIEDQAFKYKNNQHECVYVITSNFEKIRFYIDNAIEHIEFNLFSLTEEEFKLLYLCLSYETLSKDIPKKIKDESYNQEDVITKKLYSDYSSFKRELFNNLVELNPQYDSLLLFKYSQKLLDRFLFIFFAEDSNLLPPNSVKLILDQWKQLKELDSYKPLYDRFKLYFGYLNKGRKTDKVEIFAYNGGLFKEDEILDNLIINDDLLYKHTLKLSDYDFDSEVDVNILGHIFENSLNELDELKAEIEGKEIDKSKTKRKKDGVFYTPKYITKYIVDNTVGKLCNDKKVELLINEEDYYKRKKRNDEAIKGLIEKLTTYRDWLLQLKICDPACGSGAFLNQALDFLITEHRYIDELNAKLFGDALVLSDYDNTILENNLFGVDINEESVQIARLSLWLRTAKPNRKLNDLSNNIKCGNSLIDDVEVAGEKAFNWFLEFPQVFPFYNGEKHREDYIKKKENYIIKEKIKASGALKYPDQGDYNTLDVFEEPLLSYNLNSKGFEKHGFDVIIGNPPYGAQLSSIEQDYLNNKYIKGGSETVISFVKLAHSFLLKDSAEFGFIIPKSFSFSSNYDAIRNYILNDVSKIIDCKKVWKEVKLEQLMLFFTKKIKYESYITGKLQENQIIEIGKIDKSTFKEFEFFLNDISDIELEIGRKTRSSFLYINDIANNSRGGIFQNKITEEGELNVLGGAEIQRFGIIGFKGKVNREVVQNDDKCFININSLLVQRIVAHIENPFEHIKITACIPDSNNFVIVDTINQLTFNEVNSNRAFWCLLNSNLINWYSYRFIYGKAIRTMQFDNPVTKRIPIPKNFDLLHQQPFIEKADLMLLLNKELQEESQKFQRNIKREFEFNELSTKLQNWYSLSYKEFISELEKKKIKLTLSKKAEWEDYFLLESAKALEIKSKIEDTDKEIDQMVYKLYELNEEEIKIVEGN